MPAPAKASIRLRLHEVVLGAWVQDERCGYESSSLLADPAPPELLATVTGAALLAYLAAGGSGVSDRYLDAVGAAANRDPIPDDPSA